jgi:hypothetical protein
MPADKYRFVSPGVFITEVDQSQVPNLGTDAIGPVIIGRASKGPAFTPTVIRSYNEFVQKFGDTIPGGGGGDVFRNGNLTSPMYATYAARAYLTNNSPITFIRLLGAEEDNAGSTQALGAAGWKMGPKSTSRQAGAYGLFIAPSASHAASATGTLAAVFYCSGAVPILSGTSLSGMPAAKNSALLQSSGDYKGFKISISGSGTQGSYGSSEVKFFDFNRNSPTFIRKVFNTDPTRFNSKTVDSGNQYGYFLGETYEKSVNLLAAATTYRGFIASIFSGTIDGGDYRGTIATDKGPNAGSTGWYISQDLSAPDASKNFDPATDTNDLFRIHGLHANGEQTQKEIKVSIRDIRYPSAEEEVNNPYPSFTVEIRALRDTDKRRKPLETFSDCNLNPNSSNFISRKIGDAYLQYDSTTQRMQEYGDYPNVSNYVRIETSNAVKVGSENPSLMPFGVKGPLTYSPIAFLSSSLDASVLNVELPADGRTAAGEFPVAAGIPGAHGLVLSGSPEPTIAGNLAYSFTASFDGPAIQLVNSSSDLGFSDPRDAYFGVNLLQESTTTRFDESTLDLIKAKPIIVDQYTPSTINGTKYQYVFTLDNVLKTSSLGINQGTDAVDDVYYYQSGSRDTATSYTSVSGAAALVNTAKISKFTTVLHGGFDALDIIEQNPFRNTFLDGSNSMGGAGTTALTNYARSAVERAINIISDTETLDYNLVSIPGVTVPALTNKLVDMAEDRGDTLAVIDIENDYRPVFEGDPTSYPKLPDVKQAVTSMRGRSTNSSYGCAFYPWVQTRDSGTGQMIWVPASVAALGTMGSSAAKSELWFAPAGFNRGGLSKGAGGIAVTNVSKKLTSKERDDLYDVRINPIASFPSEGIVVFGQKTLQLDASALDRINVRRLLIFLKKKISQIANNILFDQNVPATWARFIGQADPILKDVQAKFGLEDYKLILDESTTTPEMRDRNIMYAKVFLKPAKSIEYIAIDFFVTNSGASFED